MTTTLMTAPASASPDPADAAGGRVWKPSRISTKQVRVGLCAVVLALIVIATIGISGVQSKKSHTTTSSQPPTQEQIQPLLFQTLNINESTVSKVLYPSITDGAKGTIILTTGETVPFTLHNYDGTFTITKD